MLFTRPVPFAEAMQLGLAKQLLPMELNSAEYRRLAAELKRRAWFSSTVTNAEILQELRRLVLRIVGGVTPEDEARRASGEGPLLMSMPEAKLQMQNFIEGTGYQAQPDEAGTIKDLTNDRRIEVMLETNIQTIQGYGQWKQGQNRVSLDLWPAWELYRLIQPIGKERDWKERFRIAGGRLVDGGRMIALRNDEVWQKLGSSELFSDGLDNPYPPFAFNSGMRIRQVSRAEAIRVGLLTEDQNGPEPMDLGLNDNLEVQADRFDEVLQEVLSDDPDLDLIDGALSLAK